MDRKIAYIACNPYKDTKSAYDTVVQEVKKNGYGLCNHLGTSTADFAVSIGGDGTFIDTAKIAENAEIIGINKGTLGYLAEIDESDIKKYLSLYFNGDYYIQKRMMLKCDGNGEALIPEMHAFNDIVVMKKDSSVIDLQIYVNNVLVVTYYADGVIVSTPSGATGYAFSCGAPIIDPESNMIIITPVAPHTVMNRSICVSSNAKIRIVPVAARGSNTCNLEVDGQKYGISVGNSINISKSPRFVKMVKFAHDSFFERIMEKMGMGRS